MMDDRTSTVLNVLRHADGLTIPQLADRTQLDLISTAAALRTLVDQGHARRKGRVAPARWEAVDIAPGGWGFRPVKAPGRKLATRSLCLAVLDLLRDDAALLQGLKPKDLCHRFGMHPSTACSLLRQARAGR